MRIGLGTALLLAATSLVALMGSPVAAATGCDAPDTTWVGPATPEGSPSWVEPSNWSGGVPTAASVVCIPSTISDPEVVEGTQAAADVVALEGKLTVGGSLDVETLDGNFGELHGPGTTTVTAGVVGEWVTFAKGAVVDLTQDAVLGGDVYVRDGSRLDVRGDTVLQPGARIDSLSDNPGLFTIAESGTLTFDTPNESAQVIGGFANHGAVTVTAGHVLMLGASPEDAHPDQFSTGTFTGAPGGTFDVSSTELRTGARLDHVRWVDHISVPEGNSVTVADSTLVDSAGPSNRVATITGAGEVVAVDGTSAQSRIGGSLTVRVPTGEIFNLDGVIQDQARVEVQAGGELREPHLSSITALDEGLIDVNGLYRTSQTGGDSRGGPDPADTLGTLRIRPGATLLKEGPGDGQPFAQVLNEGTVRVDEGGLGMQLTGAGNPSTGAFEVAERAELFLTGVQEEHPKVALGAGAILKGSVIATAHVAATGVTFDGADFRTDHTFVNGSSSGSLHLEGTTTLQQGTRLHGAGPIAVAGALESDPGAGGTAAVKGAAVTGSVRALSGTLSIPSLAPSTLTADGTLASGTWSALPGATLNLPPVTTVDAEMFLGQGASFGDRMEDLAAIGPNGRLTLGGADLAVPGLFRTEGTLELLSGSRLNVGGRFRQLATGSLVTHLDASGRGTVRAAGPRDLAGELVVERDPAYEPPVGTMLNFITSDGAKTSDDAFDRVVSPKYGTRKIRVDYGVDKVRLWVDRVG